MHSSVAVEQRCTLSCSCHKVYRYESNGERTQGWGRQLGPPRGDVDRWLGWALVQARERRARRRPVGRQRASASGGRVQSGGRLGHGLSVLGAHAVPRNLCTQSGSGNQISAAHVFF